MVSEETLKFSRKKAGLKEIEILQKLCRSDPEDRKHIIRLERFFEHKGHLCMVFENLRYGTTYLEVFVNPLSRYTA